MVQKTEKAQEQPTRARTMEDIALRIRKMRFRKKIFGGVDEADVWRQLEALHKEYEAVFLRQELYYETLLDRKETGSREPPEEGCHET